MKEWGATAGCALWLADLTSMSGREKPQDKTRCEVFCGDLWFTNYKTIEAFGLNGYNYVGQVKMGHRKIPKEFLEEEMEAFCPGASLVLEHKSKSGVEMVCIGYKYNRKRSTYLFNDQRSR